MSQQLMATNHSSCLLLSNLIIHSLFNFTAVYIIITAVDLIKKQILKQPITRYTLLTFKYKMSQFKTMHKANLAKASLGGFN